MPLAYASGSVASTCVALRSPSSRGGLRLDEVVDPRAAAADRLLRRLEQLEAGDRVEQRARLDRDALRVAEVARVLERDAQRQRMPLRPRLQLGQQLGDVHDADASPWSFRCEPQPAALTTIVIAPGESARRAAARARALSRRPAWSVERAAAGLPGGTTTS